MFGKVARPVGLLMAATALTAWHQSRDMSRLSSRATAAPAGTEKKKTECVFSYKALHNGAAPPSRRNLCPECLSQKDQDRILERIFDAIGTTNRQCVEFGFGYGEVAKTMTMKDFHESAGIISGLNTHRLIQKGWTPAFFDAEYGNSAIRLFQAVLTRENIGKHFRDAGIPLDVDYVSIDVDSIDVWLLLGLLKSGYKPRVISVEFNANWMAHMPVTCEEKWAPWKRGSRIFGSSAKAINIVGEMYGYKMVEMMSQLDVFLVRNDILEATCSNVNSLPSFEYLGEGVLGNTVHRTCDMKEASERLVDFNLALQGQHKRASEGAMEYLHELNEIRAKRNLKPFCPE